MSRILPENAATEWKPGHTLAAVRPEGFEHWGVPKNKNIVSIMLKSFYMNLKKIYFAC
jgi:hypothetical protein